MINGRKASVSLLKNAKVKLRIKDYVDSPEVSRTYDNLTFQDDKETIVSFQVPPNLSSITLTMEAGVMNNTSNSMNNWSSPERTFLI